MKNKCFSKVPLLVMSLLVISSGQAFSFSSNNKDLSHKDGLGNANLVSSQDTVSLAFAISVVVQALGTVVVRTQTIAETIPLNIPSAYRDVVLPKLQQSIGSLSQAQSYAQKGDKVQTAKALAFAITVLGQAKASATADTGTVSAIAQVLVKANQALALAQGQGTATTRATTTAPIAIAKI